MEPQPGLAAFLERFKWMTAVLVDEDACQRIAYENVEDARREGIDYLELRFSPWFMAEPHGLDPAAVVGALADGVAAGARDFGVRVQLIGILSRHYGPDVASKELSALLAHCDRLVALDLAGDEGRWPGALFVDHFRRAEDPALLDYMGEHGIGIEANLTSNVQTSTVPDLASHPLRRFLAEGLLATINTDDPAISGIDLPHEYTVAAPRAGLSNGQIQQAQKNALQLAFLSAGERTALARARLALTSSEVGCGPADKRPGRYAAPPV